MALKNWYAANDVPSPTEPRYSSWVNQQRYWFGDNYVNALLEARQIADKDLFFRAYSEPEGFESVENTVAAYKENRDKFLKDNAVEISSNLIFGNEQQGLTDFGKFLYSKGVDPTSIQNIFNSGANQVKENAAILAKWTAFEQRGSGFERFAPIIATFVAPVLAPSVAAALSVSTSTAAAVVTTAVQIAAGVDPQTAIQNAITSAVVQTGSTAAATEINSAISKVVENKELAASLSNAAGSALASAATAAAKGGSTSDIIESALAGAAGSATTAATGEAALGGAVSGGILGGAEGALAGAAGALGREAFKPSETATPKQVSAYQNVENAISSANLTAEEADAVRQAMQDVYTSASTAQALPATTTDAGGAPTRLGSPFASNDPRFLSAIAKNPALFNAFSEYTNTYGFSSAGNTVYKTLLEQELAKTPTDKNLLDEYKKITGTDYQQKLPETGAGAGRGFVNPPTVTPAAAEPLVTGAPRFEIPEELYAIPEPDVPVTPEFPAPVIEPAPVAPEAPAAAPELAPIPAVTPEPAPAYVPEITTPSPFIVATVSPDGTRALVYDASGIPKTVSIPEGVKIEPNQSVNVDPSTGSIVLPEVTPQPSPAASATPVETPPAEPGVPGRPAEPVAAAETTPTAEPGAGVGGGAVTPEVPVVSPEEPIEPVVEAEKEPIVEKEPAKTPTETTKATGQYKPSTRTSYTVSTRGPTPTSTLAQALQGQYYPLSTTGLTAYRPAGEIESEESGKGRQDVWNEASLRLKDALGL